MNRIDRLYMEMIHYYQGDPKHIQHFVKVHDLSRLIGQGEGLDEDTMYVLEAAALVHDIGIKVGMEKYGRSDGKTQEAEGPAAARDAYRTGLSGEGDPQSGISGRTSSYL